MSDSTTTFHLAKFTAGQSGWANAMNANLDTIDAQLAESQTGPVGPTGPAGATGAQGPAGSTGPTLVNQFDNNYSVWMAESTIYVRNNATGATVTGTDLAVLINPILVANAAVGGSFYFHPGVYSIGSLTQETATGGSAFYYGIGIPSNTFYTSVEWRFTGATTTVWLGEDGATTSNSTGVVFSVTPDAMAAVASSNEVAVVWQSPITNCTLVATNCSNSVYFSNITFRLPTNQRGNTSGSIMWFAGNVGYENVVADFALPYESIAAGNAPVQGTIGSWGLTSSVSSAGNCQAFSNTYATGFDTGYDFLSEHISCVRTVTAIYCNLGFVFGRLGGSAAVFHPSSCSSISSQENLTDIQFGPGMMAGSRVDLHAVDIELGGDSNWYSHTSNLYPIVYEWNVGNSVGRITFSTVKAGLGLIPCGNFFTLGGANFRTEGYLAGAVSQRATADDFARSSLGPNWSVGQGSAAISGNVLLGGTIGPATNNIYWVANSFNGPQFAQVHLHYAGNNNGMGPLVYGSGSGETFCGYLIQEPAGGNSQMTLFKVVNGAYTTLATESGTPSLQNDQIRLEVIPNPNASSVTLHCYRNNVLVPALTTVDSSSPLFSGAPGVSIYSNSAQCGVSQFSGGSFDRL
jgi:hypothetical protein